MRCFMSVVVALLLCTVAECQPIQDTVQARQFGLLDDQGRLRARLGSTDTGAPGLWLFDENGQVQATLIGFPIEGPRLILRSVRTGSTLWLAAEADGTLEATLGDRANARRLVLRLAPTGEPQIILADPQTRERVGAYVLADGSALVRVIGAGDARALLAAPSSGLPGVGVFDRNGTALASSTGSHWILWSQVLMTAGTPDNRTVAIGAWPTQTECESERNARFKALQGGAVVAVETCLPETVNLGQRR